MLKANKTVSLLLAAILVLSPALVACTIPQIAAPLPSEASNETVTLQWYMIGNRQEEDTDKVLAQANQYLKEKLKVEIELSVFVRGDEYDQKTSEALAAGEAIDIVFTSNRADNYNRNAAAGYFTELDPYLEKYPAAGKILGEEFLKACAVNGKLYGLPANKEKAHHWGFLLKKDLVRKYKMDTGTITSIETLEPFLKIIQDQEPQITPLCIAGMDAPFALLDWDCILDDNVPGALYPGNRNSKIVNQFLEPDSVAHYIFMREWYNKGYVHPEAADMHNQPELMKSGKYFAASQSLRPGKDVEIKADTDIDWVQVDVTRPVLSNRKTTEALLAIPAGSENPERAFRFIELLYTDAYVKNLFSYGIENVHYTRKSDKVISIIDAANSAYHPGNEAYFGNRFIEYLMENEDPRKWEKLLAYNGAGFVMDSLGFAFDTANVEAQVSACRNTIDVYSSYLLSGSDEVDATIAQFKKELKVCGVDELITEMQRQYDTWLAEK